jgi:hypothetical protein
MGRIALLITCLLFYFASSYGQIDTSNQILSKGIYLENLNTLIPWEINFGEIEKYGKPTLLKDPKHSKRMLIRWDSVTIFNNILLNLQTSKPNKLFTTGKTGYFKSFLALIDSSTSQKLISFLKSYTHKEGDRAKTKKHESIQWVIKPCFVSVRHDKKIGYYLFIANNGLGLSK